MVSLRNIAAAAIALAIPVVAQTTPAQVVQNIQLLTQKSQALQAPAESINIINGPLVLIGQGPFPQIISGFTDIVSTASTDLSQMQGMAAVPAGAQSDDVFDAFRDFVQVHQQLLNILIGKAGLFQTVPFIGAPIAAVLGQVENVVDSIAFALIDTTQSRYTDIQNQASSLDGSLALAIGAYNGISLSKRGDRISRVRRAILAAA